MGGLAGSGQDLYCTIPSEQPLHVRVHAAKLRLKVPQRVPGRQSCVLVHGQYFSALPICRSMLAALDLKQLERSSRAASQAACLRTQHALV